MPAQNGAGLALSYGTQGARQAGAAIVLDYAGAIGAATRVAASLRSAWQASAASNAETVAPHPAALMQTIRASAPWSEGSGKDAREGAPWGRTQAVDDRRGAPWSHYTGRAELERAAGWAISRAVDDGRGAPWGRYEGRAELEQLAAWVRSQAIDMRRAAPWDTRRAWIQLQARARFAGSTPRDPWTRSPWSYRARKVVPSWEVVIPIHQGAPEALYIVPVRSVYMQINTASLARVDTGEPLRAFSLNLSLDADSWAWSFNASVPAADQALVDRGADGEPVELEATVNGAAFRVLVEKVARDRTFPSSVLQLSGRGKTAYLDAPYSPILTFGNTDPRTAQQLVADVLTDNGAPLGWTVQWAPDDWLVPAGVFSMRGSYMAALNTIAQAAGAYVQPHATDDALAILQRYPFKPWEWDTVDPDYELPAAMMTREGIEWVEKPVYNRVYVSGVQAGSLGQVTRAGTAGDLLAAMVTDPLMTAPAAIRQRATPILCDVGRQANVTLSFPVLTGDGGTGVVVPGKFVRYVDGGTTRVGLARSISLAVTAGETESKIRQTVMLETHL